MHQSDAQGQTEDHDRFALYAKAIAVSFAAIAVATYLAILSMDITNGEEAFGIALFTAFWMCPLVGGVASVGIYEGRRDAAELAERSTAMPEAIESQHAAT